MKENKESFVDDNNQNAISDPMLSVMCSTAGVILAFIGTYSLWAYSFKVGLITTIGAFALGILSLNTMPEAAYQEGKSVRTGDFLVGLVEIFWTLSKGAMTISLIFIAIRLFTRHTS